MRAPKDRTNRRFCCIASTVQSGWIFRRRFSFCGSFYAFSIDRIETLPFLSHYNFTPQSPSSFLTALGYKISTPYAMASSTTTTSIPLQEPVFRQFLHDVHHAYLLLHRAMALIPPTMIPNMEPTPLPSTGIWDQPEGLQPEFSAHTSAFIDSVSDEEQAHF